MKLTFSHLPSGVDLDQGALTLDLADAETRTFIEALHQNLAHYNKWGGYNAEVKVDARTDGVLKRFLRSG